MVAVRAVGVGSPAQARDAPTRAATRPSCSPAARCPNWPSAPPAGQAARDARLKPAPRRYYAPRGASDRFALPMPTTRWRRREHVRSSRARAVKAVMSICPAHRRVAPGGPAGQRMMPAVRAQDLRQRLRAPRVLAAGADIAVRLPCALVLVRSPPTPSTPIPPDAGNLSASSTAQPKARELWQKSPRLSVFACADAV